MAVLKYYNTATSAWEYIAASTTANFTTWKKTMAGGETSVSGTDDNAVTLSYTVGLEQVFINGVLQVRGSDYTATTGTSVTGLSVLAVNDVVTVVCYAPFNVTNTYTKSETDGVAAAAAGLRMVVPTSVSVGSGSGSANAAGQVSFSGASSVSLNNVFSSIYDTYKILINITAATATADLNMQLLASGTPLAANYNSGYWYKQLGAGAFAGAYQSALSNWLIGGVVNSSTSGDIVSIELSNPFLSSRYKSYFANATRHDDYVWSVGGKNTSTSSYDGLRILVGSGTLSGTISVYGYKD